MKFLGHRNAENNAEQTLKAHLMNVSKLAEKFSSEFGENDAGKMSGLYHDIGKYSIEFQKYISNESKNRVDHSTAGARELFNTNSRFNLTAAFLYCRASWWTSKYRKSQNHGRNNFLYTLLEKRRKINFYV